MNFRVYELYLNNNFKKSKPGPFKKMFQQRKLKNGKENGIFKILKKIT